MLVRYSQAFVIFPGGFGTSDELFKALTLIQTRKIHDFPIVLFDWSYWTGLLRWMRRRMVPDELIAPVDSRLVRVTDSQEAVVTHIRQAHDRMRTAARPAV